MKAVILAGGLGTRLSEETAVRPKPMVEVGGEPILWHIMKAYSHHGIDDFIICAGYKGNVITEWLATYRLRHSDVTFSLRGDTIEHRNSRLPDWRVTVAQTGLESMTGGRIRRIRHYVDDGAFCLTYGDGVGDIDLTELVAFHRAEGREATMTVVQPPGRFGAVQFRTEGGSEVTHFKEKPDGDGGWINGGFFVVEPRAIDRIAGDHTVWEQEPLQTLAHDGQLSAYRHPGYWQPMDTLRDRNELERRWAEGCAPWKVW